jgi:hypothetical protein
MSDGTWRDDLPEHIRPPAGPGDGFLDQESGQRLWPLWHRCGAIALWSLVPVRSGQRVPPPERLLLADGITPLWSPRHWNDLAVPRRSTPAAPDCPGCGETVNRSLRTRPLEN